MGLDFQFTTQTYMEVYYTVTWLDSVKKQQEPLWRIQAKGHVAAKSQANSIKPANEGGYHLHLP